MRLQALARQWLGDAGSSCAASSSIATSTASQYVCPVLLQQRCGMAALLQRQQRHGQQLARLHTGRLLLSAEQGGAQATGRDIAPVSMRTLILSLMAGAGVLYATRVYTDQKMQQVVAQSQQVAGQAAVGGPFELVDQDGKRFTERDLLGEFALLYFGFTHCPDICPDELEKIAEALDLVEKLTGVQIQPVFISVDPERDRPAMVKSYVREFHPRMIGLTGELENVKAVSKAYRVYYSKTGESSTDYLVDHSIIHYLINPAGEFVTFFGKNTTAEQLAAQIVQHAAEWQKGHPEYAKGKVLKVPAAPAGKGQ